MVMSRNLHCRARVKVNELIERIFSPLRRFPGLLGKLFEELERVTTGVV